MWRVVARCAVLAAVALGLAAGPATAEVVSRDRAGDVRARGLSAGERRAMDVVRVEADGASRAGLIVEVTFRGDYARRIGRGGLRRAAVVLLLRPARGSALSGLADRGTALQDILLRNTRTTEVAALRRGRTLTFAVLGPGIENVGRIEVVTVRGRRARARARRATTPVTDLELEQLSEGDPLDQVRFVARAAAADDCGELRALERKMEALEEALEQRRRSWTRTSTENLNREIELRAQLRDAEIELSRAPENRRQAIQQKIADLRDRVAVADEFSKAAQRNRERFDERKEHVRKAREIVEQIRMARQGCPAPAQPQPPPPPPPGPGLTMQGTWRFFGSAGDEVQLAGGSSGGGNPLDAVIVEVPGGRQITAFLCPQQLPQGTVEGARLTCQGGSLPVGEAFTLNVRTSPAPANGMGGSLSGRRDGAVAGPFAISGPG